MTLEMSTETATKSALDRLPLGASTKPLGSTATVRRDPLANL